MIPCMIMYVMVNLDKVKPTFYILYIQYVERDRNTHKSFT